METSVLIAARLPETEQELRALVESAGLDCAGVRGGVEDLGAHVAAADAQVVLMSEALALTPEGGKAIGDLQSTDHIPVVVLFRSDDCAPEDWMRRIRPYGVLKKETDAAQAAYLLRFAYWNFRSRVAMVGKQDVLDMLLHTATEGFYLLDENLRYIEVNDAYCRMLKFSPDELLNLTVFDVEADEAPEGVLRQRERIDREGRMTLQRRHLNRDGEPVDVEINASRFETENGRIYCVFCRNITEELRIEKLMRLQTSALAAAANAVVITDAEGRIIWVNRAFTTYTGYTPAEAAGERPGDLLKSGEHGAAFYRQMWETIARGEVWTGEIQNRRKDGSVYTEDMTITPIFDEAGEITHYIAIKQDITEEKKLERMLRRAQRLESIGTLASGVAHDLNNVLSPVIMSADMLKLELDSPRQLEMVEMMKRGALRGADIVRQLLSFARGSESAFSPVPLKSLLKEICKVMRETFPRNIRIDTHLEGKLPEVSGDATQLHQVFTNLMINARDAMPDGGTLTLEADSVTLDEDWVRRHPPADPGTYVRVRVHDTGTGMSDQVRERIFDPFYSTKEPGKGTGLGLSTSMGILHSHKGFLDLRTEEGVGSVFDVYLPVDTSPPEEESAPDAEAPPANHGERILVVDDEESIRFMLKGTLTSLCYEVEMVENGVEALRRLEAPDEQYDLILLDMMMPEMDGAGFMREARKRFDSLPPVILISGMVEDANLRSTGVGLETRFLAKPFTIKELASKIRGVLDSGTDSA